MKVVHEIGVRDELRAQAVELLCNSFGGGDDVARRYYKDIIESKHDLYYVARDGDKLLGVGAVGSYYTVFSEGFSGKWLADFVVDEGFRGKGIAKGLIKFIEDDLTSKKVEFLNLCCSSKNEVFWEEKMGYEFSGKVFNLVSVYEKVFFKRLFQKHSEEKLPITSA